MRRASRSLWTRSTSPTSSSASAPAVPRGSHDSTPQIPSGGIPARFRQLVRAAPFECTVALAALLYAALHLSPSSYALALRQLGEEVTPWLGTPRLGRGDEWGVGTPLFQAAVNNDFHASNVTSFYSETLRGTTTLPLWDWGLVFKPELWAFFFLPPSLAYSVFWASLAAAMLIGWSLVLRSLGISRGIAAIAAALLFFSPFAQTWWTGIGPQLALFPWVLLAALKVRSIASGLLVMTVAVPVWLISQFYVPGLPALTYLALALVLAFQPHLFRSRRLVGVAGGVAAGLAIVWLYYRPVLDAFVDSFYPGDRWFGGGALPPAQALSQLLPSTTTEGHTSLLAMNISEVSTVATWLPLLTLCLVDVRAVKARYDDEVGLRRDVRRVLVLLTACIPLTLWQLTPWLEVMSYALGLGLGPEQRTLFASGALLVIASAYALDRLPLAVTPIRLTIFAVAVVGAWLAATVRYPGDETLVDELFVLIPAVLLVPLAVRRPRSQVLPLWSIKVTAGLVALSTVVWGWALFNPVQSTRVMFRKPNTEVTRSLDRLAASRADRAIAVEGYSGAVLNGVGYRSVTHVITVPNPALFRRWFPFMPERRFNRLFNRYLRIGLTDARQPQLVRADEVLLPKQRMSRFAAVG
jgi:hypothetical protein